MPKKNKKNKKKTTKDKNKKTVVLTQIPKVYNTQIVKDQNFMLDAIREDLDPD